MVSPDPMIARVRKPLRAAGFAAITASMAAVYGATDEIAARTGGDRERLRDEWTDRWARALLRLFGIHVEVHSEKGDDGSTVFPSVPPRTEGRGRLVIANHRSTIDIAVLLSTFGGHMVSKADLGQWPVLGFAARRVGTLFVERERATSGAELIRAMRTKLKEGRTICIFPEGTTFAGDEVRPFHQGAFAAAYKSGCEIVPVGLAYQTGSGAAFTDETFMEHLSRMASAPPTRVAAVVGEPFLVGDQRGADLLSESHARVVACTNLARRKVDRTA